MSTRLSTLNLESYEFPVTHNIRDRFLKNPSRYQERVRIELGLSDERFRVKVEVGRRASQHVS